MESTGSVSGKSGSATPSPPEDGFSAKRRRLGNFECSPTVTGKRRRSDDFECSSTYPYLAKRPALSELEVGASVSKYEELASYLVNVIDLQDEGVFRQLARRNNISSYTPDKVRPDTQRVITVLGKLEPLITSKEKQFNLVLSDALGRQRLFPNVIVKQQFEDRFITTDMDFQKQEFLAKEAEVSSKEAQGSLMTDDNFRQPYYPCSSYQGHRYFDQSHPVMDVADGPENLETSRYNKESLSASGNIQRVHAGTSSKASRQGLSIEVPDDALPGVGIAIRDGMPPGFNPDGTYTDEAVCSRVCYFWQKVFSRTDSVSSTLEDYKADITLVIDGKVHARHARSNGQMITDSLSANLIQNLPRIVIAMTKEAGSQFIDRRTRSQVDLVKMIQDENITIYCASEALVHVLGLAALEVMFEKALNDPKGSVAKVSTGIQTLTGSAMKVLSMSDIVNIGLTLQRTQSFLRQKASSQ